MMQEEIKKAMINIEELKETDKGRLVSYSDGIKTEIGRITSWNSRYIFVDFTDSERGQACYPRSLNFVQNEMD
jgi:hypothetical protein